MACRVEQRMLQLRHMCRNATSSASPASVPRLASWWVASTLVAPDVVRQRLEGGSGVCPHTSFCLRCKTQALYYFGRLLKCETQALCRNLSRLR